MKPLIVLALVFGLGGCLGARMGESPEVEFVEVTRTKVIREPAPPAEKVYIPLEACVQAAGHSYLIARNAERIFMTGTKQLAILSDARKALASGDDLNPVDNRQRKLQSNSTAALINLEEALRRFERDYPLCDKETQ